MDRFEVAHRSAWEWMMIGCCCTFSSYMSWIATVKAKLVIKLLFVFFWRESATSSAMTSETAVTSVCHVDFDGDVFFNFPNVRILGSEAPRGSAARRIVDVPISVQLPGFLD